MSQAGFFRSGSILTVTGNVGGPVGPDAGQNINIVGSGTITVTGNPGAHTLTISTSGAVATTYTTDAGNATPLLGVLDVLGGANINTAGASNVITINLDDAISLPDTNVALTSGALLLNGDRFLHKYGTGNTFLGQLAGNTSLATATSSGNTGIGQATLASLTNNAFSNTAVGALALSAATTGALNTGIGNAALLALTTGSSNVAIGGTSLGQLQAGSRNIAVGTLAGNSYTTIESSNICIGNTGTVGDNNTIRIGTDGNMAGQQDQTFIAGTVTTARDLTVTTGNANVLAGNITLPATNVALTEGVLLINGDRFLYAPPGTLGSNTFVGSTAGNGTLTGDNNTGLGTGALASLTTGGTNTAVGSGALALADTPSNNSVLGFGALGLLGGGTGRNVAIGSNVGGALDTGAYNCLIGYTAGNTYTGAESSNILINSAGVLGESNRLRIGNATGTGNQELDAAYISGIYNKAVGATNGVVTIDNGNKLGSSNGGNGQLLIGGGTGPVWANITPGAGISIANAANSITISSSATFTYTNVNVSPYVVQATDYYLGVDCSVAAITIQFPDAPSAGRVFVVKDFGGFANTNNITLTSVSGLIGFDGALTYVMNANFESISLLFDGTNYQIF